ncbi:MAG: aminotransferase class I/II-fold pyridoxal phosphate-dependent enzyme [Planctomycetota bacterium]|nr:MAG: aminotransferase class I/II-fold pyridoxal phosphate-dependent enzyme [Planctomycetota bacterium]
MSRTRPFEIRAEKLLASLSDSGQYKVLQMIQGPMGPVVRLRQENGTSKDVLCFCSNNYLGLANEPRVVEAGIEGLRTYGAGTASVRFICGTFEPHERLERTIAEYMGTESSYTFVSCWTATEALFPTVCEPGDIIISDELNHACIIDAIRLTPVIKKGVKKSVYKHSDMASLRAALEAAASDDEITGQIWVVTDGVFSMEGDIAKLPEIRQLCDEFNAMLVVDDSHGHGVMGRTGRGTHEHFGMIGRNDYGNVDCFTGTLGKALGGGAGGFVAGSSTLTDLLVQRARPTLFSNALPVTVACSADRAIQIVMDEPERVTRLKNNVEIAREKIAQAGFEVIDSPTAICPIIIGETAEAIRMSKRLLELGVFVIGFGYPVVPEGTARLRIQMSAAHTDAHIEQLVDALRKL